MMESEFKNKKELLQQLNILRAEKELLQKHVFVLNECLSVDELKAKIAHLEKKQETLVLLEKSIEKLRIEIEPLKYLKSILENKLIFEKETNKIWSESFRINSKSSIPKADTEFLTKSKGCITSETCKTQVPTDSIKTDSVSFQTLCDEKNSTIQTSTNSNLVTVSNDVSVDECMQLLDQYDVVTDQEISNFVENNLKTQSVTQESTSSVMKIVDSEVQGKQTATTSTYFDAEGVNVPTKNENDLTVDGNMESSVNNGADIDSTNPNNCNNQPKASTSQSFQNQDNFFVDSNVNVGDLLLKIPQMLLQHGVDSLKVLEKSNKSSKNDGSDVTLKEHNTRIKTPDIKNDIVTLKEKIDNIESTEPNLNRESSYAKNSESNTNSFNDMDLKIDILRGIYSLGFVHPTPLQQHVIQHCVNGRDMIVFAGPGNGRTMMFTIPLLQRINTNINDCQALVLVPTYDLAVHVQKIIISVGDFLGINVCIGGDNFPRKLSVIPHVVVGTPAGVSKMIACKSLFTGFIHTLVVNKADKMLTHVNYTKLIEEIMGKLKKKKQVTLLTSDKLDRVLDIYMDYLRDPLVIFNDSDTEKEMEILKSLPKQFYLNIQEEWKMNALCEVWETLNIQRAIIFCNSLERAHKLFESLQKLEYAVSLFHLDMSARDREHILAMFSSNGLRILITIDPIKGSQFQQASWIINFDLPCKPIRYLDRIIQCAENIKVLNFINENENKFKLAIETHSKSPMIQMPLNLIDLLQY